MSWAPRRPSWLSSSGPLIPPSSTSSMASSIRVLGAILRSTAWSPLRLARSALEPTPSSLLQRVQDATPDHNARTQRQAVHAASRLSRPQPAVLLRLLRRVDADLFHPQDVDALKQGVNQPLFRASS